jgi:hypothetical protein
MADRTTGRGFRNDLGEAETSDVGCAFLGREMD